MERRKLLRDFQVSLGLLIAGFLILAAWGALYWIGVISTRPGNFAGVTFLSASLLGIGGSLVLIGAVFAGVNGLLLRTAKRPGA